MKIVYEEHFVKSLKNILSYIALDKKSAAKTFKSKLITQKCIKNHFTVMMKPTEIWYFKDIP